METGGGSNPGHRWAYSTLGVIIATLLGYLVTDRNIGQPAAIALATIGGLIAAILAAISISNWITSKRQAQLCGINRASLEESFSLNLRSIWDQANTEITVFGMALSHLSRNAEIIRTAVDRGVKVRLVLMDPDWLTANPALVSLLSDFYDTQNIVGKLQDSRDRLLRLRDELNRASGSGSVTVDTYRNAIMMSATIGDCNGSMSRGVIEFHMYRAGEQRFRVGVTSTGIDRTSLISLATTAVSSAVNRAESGHSGAPVEYAIPPCRAVILTRSPVPGIAKTRLIGSSTASLAQPLLDALLRQTALNCIDAFGKAECVHYGERAPVVRSLAGLRIDLSVSPAADHLTALVTVVNERVSIGQFAVVAVASDAPTVSSELLTDCATALARFDVAVVPSTDGGICALATRRTIPPIDPDLSTRGGSLVALEAGLRSRGATLAILETRTDIDDRESLLSATRNGMLDEHLELDRTARNWLDSTRS